MTPDIKSKLGAELSKGITTEVQVVYLMVGIRKILERNNELQQYPHLNFHCNWVLHPNLTNSYAQNVLSIFENIHLELSTGSKPDELPLEITKQLRDISRMDLFQEELDRFLETNGMPGLDANRTDGWVYFLHLYAQVIKDIPLMIKPSTTSDINRVIVDIEFANKVVADQMNFRLIWTVEDKWGNTGSHTVYNSFSLKSE